MKILLLIQTVIIFFMSFWIYQEYLNNMYLQTYISGFVQGGVFTAIVLGSVGVFAIVGMALFAKLRSTRRELEGLLSTGTIGQDGSRTGRQVETGAIQHLAELIRETTPVTNSGAYGGMPVLRRVDRKSSREE